MMWWKKLSEKSFEFEFTVDKGRFEKALNSIFASTKFSSKEPIIIVKDGLVEGWDLSVRALIPYVRCNPSFFISEVTGEGYFTLTKTLLEKFKKGFQAGSVTFNGKALLKEVGNGVEITGEISITGENANYSEPITLPEFPDKVQTSKTWLSFFPEIGLKVERNEQFAVAQLKLAMVCSGIMSIQDISAMPPSDKMTMSFQSDGVVASIKDAGRYSRNLPIEYIVAPESDNLDFLANNDYFGRAVENMQGKVLTSIYGIVDVEESIIVFSQKTEDLEYIFLVSGKN